MATVTRLFNENFLEYASYVIKDRAIPHLDDGLKPVQRRILHSLLEMDDGKFHKVANVVGHCMQYHPHGDASIYSALVVLAQKGLFIDTQGNFGNALTGDAASAARYIECRVLPFAREIFYNPELTEFEPSYDGRRQEPVTFPAKLPVVLALGAEGIAVGMSTRILPHNLVEIIDAMRSALAGEAFLLLPDFPGGGVLDAGEYEDGTGKVRIRAKLDLKDPKRIVIREIPFGTTTESVIASVEAAARKNKIKIQSISDYTGEQVEIEIKPARGVYAADLEDALYAFTECETSITVNPLVIRDRRPQIMPVSEIVAYHAERLVSTLQGELELEKGHLLDKIHARTLERIFIEERIYRGIEEQASVGDVRNAVLSGFEPFRKEIRRAITDEDIERLLQIPIRRISRYDIEKARDELRKLETRLKEVRTELADIRGYTDRYLADLRERVISGGSGGKDGAGPEYGRERRTRITSFDRVDVREAALRNLVLRYDPETGYLGHALSSGKSLFAVSPYDRVFVLRKSGTWQVIDVPEKLFVDKGLIDCRIADREELAKTVMTIVYRPPDGETTYIKRFRIEGFILGRSYELIPDGSRVFVFTTAERKTLHLTYKPRARQQITEEDVRIEDFLVKSAKAGGVRLSPREVKSIRST